MLCLDARLHIATFMWLLLGADAFPWWIEGSYSVIQVGTNRPNFLSGKSDKWNNETLFREKIIIWSNCYPHVFLKRKKKKQHIVFVYCMWNENHPLIFPCLIFPTSVEHSLGFGSRSLADPKFFHWEREKLDTPSVLIICFLSSSGSSFHLWLVEPEIFSH